MTAIPSFIRLRAVGGSRSILLICCALCFLFILTISCKPRANPGALLKEANSRLEGGDWDGAISAYTKVIALDPKSAAAYAGLGVISAGRGDLTTALSDFTAAILLDSNSALAHAGRGDTWCRMGDWDRAIVDCTRAIELNYEQGSVYATRAFARSEKLDWAGAISDSSKAIELEPDWQFNYRTRGQARIVTKDWDGAIADYSKAIALISSNINVGGIGTVIRLSNGALLATQSNATQTADAKTNLAQAYHFRAFAYERKGLYDAAIADYSMAIQLNPRYAMAYNNRALARVGKWDRPGDWNLQQSY